MITTPSGVDMRKQLCEVTTREQLENYYNLNSLQSIEEKIASLRRVMGVMAVRCAEGETPENILSALEGSVFYGNWKIS